MTAKLLKNKLIKKTPLLMSPFGFALAACGGVERTDHQQLRQSFLLY